MKKNETYLDSVHRAGRIGSLLALGFMVGIPVIMCFIYDCFPSISKIIQAAVGILAMMLPLDFSEIIGFAPILGSSSYITFITGNVMNLKLPVVISAQQIAEVEANTVDFSEIIGFAPILGSSSYITFITGNVMNLKLPVVISAQQIAEVEANTEEADAVSSYAVALSSIETIAIIALCVLLLKPLQPVFELPVVQTATQYVIPASVSSYAVALSSIETIAIIALCVLLLKPLQPVFELPVVQTATQYVIPALFGSLILGLFSKGSGESYVKNKPLIVILPVFATILALLFIPGMQGYQGFAVLASIPLAIGWAYILYKKEIVRMEKNI